MYLSTDYICKNFNLAFS